MAGLLCAYKLAQAGVDYALVEADRICGGVTKNTTAKITSQHGLIYDKLIREFGVERARLYLEANQAALEKYRTLCRSIDCNFEEKDSFVSWTVLRPQLVPNAVGTALATAPASRRMGRLLTTRRPTISNALNDYVSKQDGVTKHIWADIFGKPVDKPGKYDTITR